MTSDSWRTSLSERLGQNPVSNASERAEEQGDRPSFLVGDVAVYGDVILAPMAGFADVPTREVFRRFGSAMSYTEFVAVEEILNGSGRNHSLLDFVEPDRPMVFQVFGNDAHKILAAAQRIEELGPDIIDINMGCSTRRVSGRGAGVGMMLDPGLISETFRLLSQHLNVPITGKIRLGWESKKNYIEVARIMEDNGAALIAIHPRTKEQKYRGRAHWEAIAELGQSVSVPIIGNGDVIIPADIDAMLNQTGCQAVMIGRGALGNPWLFSRIDKFRLRFDDVCNVISEHLGGMLRYHGERGIILFRKHLKRYLAGASPVKPYYRRMVVARSAEEVLDELAAAQERFGSHKLGMLTE